MCSKVDLDRNFRPARFRTFEHTISGLLTKRREMLTEAEYLRDRLAEISALTHSGGMPKSALGRDDGCRAPASRKSSTRVIDQVCHDLAKRVPAT